MGCPPFGFCNVLINPANKASNVAFKLFEVRQILCVFIRFNRIAISCQKHDEKWVERSLNWRHLLAPSFRTFPCKWSLHRSCGIPGHRRRWSKVHVFPAFATSLVRWCGMEAGSSMFYPMQARLTVSTFLPNHFACLICFAFAGGRWSSSCHGWTCLARGNPFCSAINVHFTFYFTVSHGQSLSLWDILPRLANGFLKSLPESSAPQAFTAICLATVLTFHFGIPRPMRRYGSLRFQGSLGFASLQPGEAVVTDVRQCSFASSLSVVTSMWCQNS